MEGFESAVTALVHVFLHLGQGADGREDNFRSAAGHDAQANPHDNDRDGFFHGSNGGHGGVQVFGVGREGGLVGKGRSDFSNAETAVDVHHVLEVGVVEAECAVVAFQHHRHLVEHGPQLHEPAVQADVALDVHEFVLAIQVQVVPAGQAAHDVHAFRDLVPDGLGIERDPHLLGVGCSAPDHADLHLYMRAVGGRQIALRCADHTPVAAVGHPAGRLVFEGERLHQRGDGLSVVVPVERAVVGDQVAVLGDIIGLVPLREEHAALVVILVGEDGLLVREDAAHLAVLLLVDHHQLPVHAALGILEAALGALDGHDVIVRRTADFHQVALEGPYVQAQARVDAADVEGLLHGLVLAPGPGLDGAGVLFHGAGDLVGLAHFREVDVEDVGILGALLQAGAEVLLRAVGELDVDLVGALEPAQQGEAHLQRLSLPRSEADGRRHQDGRLPFHLEDKVADEAGLFPFENKAHRGGFRNLLVHGGHRCQVGHPVLALGADFLHQRILLPADVDGRGKVRTLNHGAVILDFLDAGAHLYRRFAKVQGVAATLPENHPVGRRLFFLLLFGLLFGFGLIFPTLFLVSLADLMHAPAADDGSGNDHLPRNSGIIGLVGRGKFFAGISAGLCRTGNRLLLVTHNVDGDGTVVFVITGSHRNDNTPHRIIKRKGGFHGQAVYFFEYDFVLDGLHIILFSFFPHFYRGQHDHHPGIIFLRTEICPDFDGLSRRGLSIIALMTTDTHHETAQKI